MGSEEHLKIVIASAGRRAHYIEWFQEALRTQGIAGDVIALEFRSTSPSCGVADRAVQMPAYNSPEYSDALQRWCEAERPDVFLSLNDYELQVLSAGLADTLRGWGCTVAALSSSAQAVVLDKHRMATALKGAGIPTPDTWLGSEASTLSTSHAGNVETSSDGSEFVIKHRFGSGSAGLMFSSASEVEEAVSASASSALGRDGQPAYDDLDAVVVQTLLPGPEYGVDGVFAMDGSAHLLGALARRKDQMRGGDTDVATSVSADPFTEPMRRIGGLLSPVGAIDVDFRETSAGEPLVIDINPRLGGGYPFNHRAGADLPGALIRSAAGRTHDPQLLHYDLGVTTARREEFTVISQPRQS